MFLSHLSLQNFRSYTKSAFTFHKDTTIIVGRNTAGKTNLLEAIYFLAKGKSFLAEKDIDVMHFGEEITRIKGLFDTENKTILEVMITSGSFIGREAPLKRYLVNNIPKRRADFASNFTAVFFSPADLAMITNGPSLRRSFLDLVLEQADKNYALALSTYTKTLRQRNALLDTVKETGRRDDKVFAYWDDLLIKNGTFLTQKREAFLDFITHAKKDIFPLQTIYDKSIISKERLLQYKDAESGSGVTLVGPHRDDFSIRIHPNKNTAKKAELVDIKQFGSRGQQRLAILQLKLLEIAYLDQARGERPMLLLDDIFSELDATHIELVLAMIGKQQTILTTTHKEFIEGFVKPADVIELG